MNIQICAKYLHFLSCYMHFFYFRYIMYLTFSHKSKCVFSIQITLLILINPILALQLKDIFNFIYPFIYPPMFDA